MEPFDRENNYSVFGGAGMVIWRLGNQCRQYFNIHSLLSFYERTLFRKSFLIPHGIFQDFVSFFPWKNIWKWTLLFNLFFWKKMDAFLMRIWWMINSIFWYHNVKTSTILRFFDAIKLFFWLEIFKEKNMYWQEMI